MSKEGPNGVIKTSYSFMALQNVTSEYLPQRLGVAETGHDYVMHGNENNPDGSSEGTPPKQAFRAEYESGDSDSLCEAVTHVMEVATGMEPTALDPLYSTVDPEDIAALFRGRSDPAARVSFTYEGYEVTVRACDEISVTALPEAEWFRRPSSARVWKTPSRPKDRG